MLSIVDFKPRGLQRGFESNNGCPSVSNFIRQGIYLLWFMCVRLRVCVCVCVCVCVQKWLNALNEHIAFSTHYTHQGEQLEEEEEELVPLGTMQDSLQVRDWYQREINLVCVCVFLWSLVFFCVSGTRGPYWRVWVCGCVHACTS